MKKRLFNLSFNKRYSLIRISFVFMIFMFSSHATQSRTPYFVYEVSPNIQIETHKIKAEVLFVFEQTLIESGFKITRHRVIGKNRYLYEITLRYKNFDDIYYGDIYHGELILFCEIGSDNYVLERVLFKSSDLEIDQLGEEIVSNLIINPFKAKVSE